MRQKAIFSFVFILLVLFLIVPVTAVQYISFAQPDTTIQKDIYLYGWNTTSEKFELLGLYNTTSADIAIPEDTDIMFVLKPQYSSPLDDPGTFMDSGFAYVETNIFPLIAIIFLIGLLLTRK